MPWTKKWIEEANGEQREIWIYDKSRPYQGVGYSLGAASPQADGLVNAYGKPIRPARRRIGFSIEKTSSR